MFLYIFIFSMGISYNYYLKEIMQIRKREETEVRRGFLEIF